MGKQKEINALAAAISIATVLQAQNAGINTTALQAMLHLKDSSVLFSGTASFVNYAPSSMPPARGAGTRLMWYAPGMALLLSESSRTQQIQMEALTTKINSFEKI